VTFGPLGQALAALISICAYDDSPAMDGIYNLQAEVLKTLASPRRLEILHRLSEGPCEVGRLADELGISQPNVSQHLAVLRSSGVVEAERDGREVRYRLADPDVMVACSIMRGVLQRRIRRLAGLPVEPPAAGPAINATSSVATGPVPATSP
jgi:ArsR family transcriptional regulator